MKGKDANLESVNSTTGNLVIEKMNSEPPSLDMGNLNDEFLDGMRKIGDVDADALMDTFFHEMLDNPNHKSISGKLSGMAETTAVNPHNPGIFDKELPYSFYFSPQEKEKFKLAFKVYEKHGLKICLLLFFKSLPTGYMCPKASTVLGTTRLLEDYAARRVFETAQFLFLVSHNDFYKKGSAGYEAIKKLRLIHSSMRVMIQHPSRKPEWDSQTLGVPINQEDMVLTNQLFSLAIIEGLCQMGVKLTDEEAEAYFYKWKIIGRMIGISQELEPKNLKDAWKLQNLILKRQVAVPNPNIHGPELTMHLFKAIETFIPERVHSKDHKPEKFMGKICIYFVKHPLAAEALGLTKPSYLEKLIDSLIFTIVNSNWWQKHFAHKDRHKEPGFLAKKLRKLLNKRLGFSGNAETSSKTDLLEVLVGHILKGMEQSINNEKWKFKLIKNPVVEKMIDDLNQYHTDLAKEK